MADSFNLRGTVEPAALRSLLEGRDPATGHTFLPAPATCAPSRGSGSGDVEGTITADAAAGMLGVSTRTVRRWATAGEAAWTQAQAATTGRALRTAAEVRARLTELGLPAVEPGAPTCLLVAPVAGRRRRFDIPVEEVERLRETRRAPSTRQGYDVVFRPAKGWSVLWAVGRPELRHALQRIHHRAVDDAVAYLENTAARGRVTVLWMGRRVRIRAQGDGFVAACFDHRESRAGDPLLHTQYGTSKRGSTSLTATVVAPGRCLLDSKLRASEVPLGALRVADGASIMSARYGRSRLGLPRASPARERQP